MTLVDPDGMERMGSVGKKKRQRGPTGTFTSLVSNTLYKFKRLQYLRDQLRNLNSCVRYHVWTHHVGKEIDIFIAHYYYLSLISFAQKN